MRDQPLTVPTMFPVVICAETGVASPTISRAAENTRVHRLPVIDPPFPPTSLRRNVRVPNADETGDAATYSRGVNTRLQWGQFSDVDGNPQRQCTTAAVVSTEVSKFSLPCA